jgi:hypothetical protein
MTVDDDIRAAFETLADCAPHPARVLQGLARAAQVHRQRRALLLAGGAAAVVGGTIAATRGLFVGTGPSPDVPTTPTPTPTPTTGNPRVPMRYRPAYLPEGVHEVWRATGLSADSVQVRFWSDKVGREPSTRQVQLAHTRVAPWTNASDPTAAETEPVRIGDADGRVWGGATRASVGWPLPDGWFLEILVMQPDDSVGTALLIARSVVPDGVASLEFPLEFRWYPTEAPMSQFYWCSPVYGPNMLSLAIEGVTVASVRLERGMSGLPGSPQAVTVRGLTGSWSRDDQSVSFALPLPDGRAISVWFGRGRVEGNGNFGLDPSQPYTGPAEFPLSDEDALRVVEELWVGPEPANEWYLSR